MNISESILVLMLLWLIGGSPPVRSRKVPTISRDQKQTNIYGLNELSIVNNNITLRPSEHIISTKSKDFNESSCNERRSLLQIVIDTPIIYEVTVVSKSVEGKHLTYVIKASYM